MIRAAGQVRSGSGVKKTIGATGQQGNDQNEDQNRATGQGSEQGKISKAGQGSDRQGQQCSKIKEQKESVTKL